MDLALRPRSELLRSVTRLAAGPVALLLVIGGFFVLAGVYIGYFGSAWGLLLLLPGLGVLAGALALCRRLWAGRAAIAAGHPYLQVSATGVQIADEETIGWEHIERLELQRAAETPLDAQPAGARATVMNAGGTRGRWRLQRTDGTERTGRFDLVPTREYHARLVSGRDHARAGGALLLDQPPGA